MAEAKRDGRVMPDETEITPEMIEAGADVIFGEREVLTAWSLAEEVYRAMERARKSGQ